MADNKDNKLNIGEEPNSKDINKNVGSFSNTVVPAVSQPEKAPEPTKNIKTSQVKEDPEINFEKFNKTKKRSRLHAATTKFGVKVESWLSNPKKLAIVWGIIILVIAVLYALQIFYIIALDKAIKSGSNVMNIVYVHNCASAGTIISYVSILFPLLPLLFLVTSWFIGINGVASSKIFHYIFWVILLICITLLIASSICSFISLDAYWSFHQPKTL